MRSEACNMRVIMWYEACMLLAGPVHKTCKHAEIRPLFRESINRGVGSLWGE
jgi:hypothetical protein